MRGMKKWMPFKSLSGQYEVLEQMKAERKKTERPELSLDEIDDLNHYLITMKKGDKARVTYYQQGNIITKVMTFIRCDGYQQSALFKGQALPFTDLIRIEI